MHLSLSLHLCATSFVASVPRLWQGSRSLSHFVTTVWARRRDTEMNKPRVLVRKDLSLVGESSSVRCVLVGYRYSQKTGISLAAFSLFWALKSCPSHSN